MLTLKFSYFIAINFPLNPLSLRPCSLATWWNGIKGVGAAYLLRSEIYNRVNLWWFEPGYSLCWS